jgi:phosphoglycolate phosphatase-like HAD superfamily hydrolase
MIKKFTEFVNEDAGTTKFRVFCDLDGVLVDFDRGFKELPDNTDNLSPKEYESKHGKDSIWPAIDKLGEAFWTNLPWMKDGRELWDYIKRYDPIILSSPSRHPGCFTGKAKWVNANLGIDQAAITDPADFTEETRFILASQKHEYVEPAKTLLHCEPILIDDFERKLEKWTAAGGIGVLHNDSTDTVRVLEETMGATDND